MVKQMGEEHKLLSSQGSIHILCIHDEIGLPPKAFIMW
jgi:hypothetical protein